MNPTCNHCGDEIVLGIDGKYYCPTDGVTNVSAPPPLESLRAALSSREAEIERLREAAEKSRLGEHSADAEITRLQSKLAKAVETLRQERYRAVQIRASIDSRIWSKHSQHHADEIRVRLGSQMNAIDACINEIEQDSPVNEVTEEKL